MNPFAPSALDAVQRQFAIDPAALLRYDDPRAGTSRRLVVGDRRLRLAMLLGDEASESWLRHNYLENGTPVAAIGRMLLSPSAAAPAAGAERGRTVCACFGVGEQAIVQALRRCAGGAGARLEAVQRKLSCGTQCGSCVPELRQLAAPRDRRNVGRGSLCAGRSMITRRRSRMLQCSIDGLRRRRDSCELPRRGTLETSAWRTVMLSG